MQSDRHENQSGASFYEDLSHDEEVSVYMERSCKNMQNVVFPDKLQPPILIKCVRHVEYTKLTV